MEGVRGRVREGRALNALAVLALIAAAGRAQAPSSAPVEDILCLKDGRVVSGPRMSRFPGGVDVHYKAGTIRVPENLIQESVLAEDLDPAATAPATPEEIAKTKEGLVRFEGHWTSPALREEILRKRILAHKTELEEMRAHGEWKNRYREDGKYFRFEYTVPPRIFAPYRDAMEAYFAEFARAWKVQPARNGFRLPVSFFADEPSFLQIGGVPKGVLGYFDPIRKDLNIFYERQDPRLSSEVMFHEANHYLQSLVEPKFWVPHFPAESLAEYYGACRYDPVTRKLDVGLLLEHRLCQIEADVAGGDLMDLAKLVSTEDLFEHYTWGWSLVHFLMKDPKTAAKFQKFFLALPEAKGVERKDVSHAMYTISQKDVFTIFRRELGLKDFDAIRKMEADWHDYVKSKLQLVTCSGYEQAGLEAKRDGRVIRATRLLTTAIEKGSRNPLVHQTLACLLVDDGETDRARAVWQRALELDPLDERAYFRMSQRLRGKDETEAKRLRALALELGADDPFGSQVIDTGEDEPPEPGKEPHPGDQPGKPKKPGAEPGWPR